MNKWNYEKEFHRGVNAIFAILYALVIAKGLEVIGRNIPAFSLSPNFTELAASIFFTFFMVVLAVEITRAKEVDKHYVEGRGKYGSLIIYLVWISQYGLHYGFIQSIELLPIEGTLPRYMSLVMLSFCLYIICDLIIMRKNPFASIEGYSNRPFWALLFYGSTGVFFLFSEIAGHFDYKVSLPYLIISFVWLGVYLCVMWKASLGE